jgi:hypothetical protein
MLWYLNISRLVRFTEALKKRVSLQAHLYLSYEDGTGKCLLRQAPLSSKHLIVELRQIFAKSLALAVSRCPNNGHQSTELASTFPMHDLNANVSAAE